MTKIFQEDAVLIKNLYPSTGYFARRLSATICKWNTVTIFNLVSLPGSAEVSASSFLTFWLRQFSKVGQLHWIVEVDKVKPPLSGLKTE